MTSDISQNRMRIINGAGMEVSDNLGMARESRAKVEAVRIVRDARDSIAAGWTGGNAARDARRDAQHSDAWRRGVAGQRARLRRQWKSVRVVSRRLCTCGMCKCDNAFESEIRRVRKVTLHEALQRAIDSAPDIVSGMLSIEGAEIAIGTVISYALDDIAAGNVIGRYPNESEWTAILRHYNESENRTRNEVISLLEKSEFHIARAFRTGLTVDLPARVDFRTGNVTQLTRASDDDADLA